MGSYFTDRFEAIAGLPAAIAQAPIFFLIAFSIGGVLIWFKYWVIGRSTKRSIASRTHGHWADADRRHIRHETGIGTTEVLVMRQNGLGGMIWFAVFFFGGGAVFYALVVLQSPDVTTKDWLTFSGLLIFTIVGMAAIEVSQTCIYVHADRLERRRVLHRRQFISFADIASVAPHGKSFAGGIVIHAASGDKMRILASFSGYSELLTRLGEFDPKLKAMASLMTIRKVRNARTSRG